MRKKEDKREPREGAVEWMHESLENATGVNPGHAEIVRTGVSRAEQRNPSPGRQVFSDPAQEVKEGEGIGDTKGGKAQPTMREIFGPKGLLAKCHAGYEYRGSQLEMAELVEEAFTKKQHTMVEAGTGTGKTLAYLLPAIRSGRTVVISTATKSLQEQLFQKDIPFLKRYFAPNLKVAVMKGRANFLCRHKVTLLDGQPVLKGLDDIDWFNQIKDWSQVTETGDRAELTFLPDGADLWPRLDARRETCTGQKCPDFERCFITWMHQRAQEAEILIVNHHLFFADLAIRKDDFGSILPEYSAVIFDEAHEIEEVASEYFGRQISNYRFEELARDAEQVLRLKGLAAPGALKRCARVKEKTRSLFELFPQKEGRFPFPAAERTSFLERNREACDGLADAVKKLESSLSALPQKPDEVQAVARRGYELRKEMEFLLESNEKAQVYWYERRGKGVFVAATPIDVGPILREKLFDKFDTVVLTSATLAVGGKFEFLRQRLGMESPREKALPPEFDFKRQCVLYVPKDVPDVRQAGFSVAAGEEITRLLKISQGRAFCLFTSYAQMNDVVERVRGRVDYPVLVQGTAPRPILLEKFRNTAHAVLFATASFWQGVDVRGEQLSCVIVDKLPFAVPSDPVVAARVQALKDEGRDAFHEYQVPEAVLALKQGFGRLIRSKTDRGMLALLDNRITRMAYGKIFLASLPEYTLTSDIAQVERFMRQSQVPGS